MPERPLIAIVGPTGTGKSDLSLELAERLAASGTAAPAEIVNADAMQLYRGMDVGTAKLAPSERRGIPHHMLDVLDPDEDASVAWYQNASRQTITDIRSRGHIPILVGGSGLYVSGVIHELSFPGSDPAVRAALEAELAERGTGALYARLRERDPHSAASVDPANARRVVRALEVLAITGKPQITELPEMPAPWTNTAIIALETARHILTSRLDARVQSMWTRGLVDEAVALLPRGIERGTTASRAIGYAQALAQHRGALSEREAIEQTQALTRRYARRQMGWFRRYADATWFDTEAQTRDELADRVLDHLRATTLQR